jgi:hypothetical protein
MDDTQMHKDPYVHNTFWHEDQVCITFQLSHSIPTIVLVSREAAAADEGREGETAQEKPRTAFPPTFIKTAAISAMNLQDLKSFLAGKYSLSSFKIADTLQPEGAAIAVAHAEDDINSEIGKYLFTTRDEQGRFVPTVIGFFHFKQVDQVQASAASTFADLAPMFESSTAPGGSGNTTQAADDHGDSHENGKLLPTSPVVDLVKLINRNLNELRAKGVPIVAASPVWLAGATNGGPSDPKPVGCPLTPPIPMPGDAACPSSPGLFPIALPELPRDLRSMTGDGVIVFVLDTLPKAEEINRAAEAAEGNNLLLLDVANNTQFHHNRLPDVLDVPNASQPKTGKDISGKIIGFRMPDHGLFVAGIVRDIAPNAHVECVRVLNDYCTGSLPTLTKALEGIHNRMLLINPDTKKPDGTYEQGDLLNKPIVVSLSLVIPDDMDVIPHGFDASDLDYVRKGLLRTIQSLVDLGVVFVASAGNEGDLRYKPGNPGGVRPEALYPAAFAYHGLVPPEMMIPVGAVNKHKKAASYSCYPGKLGVSTYGGEVPKAYKEHPSDCFTEARDIDALIGLYTALSSPALSKDDCELTRPVPNTNAWTYWTGTSFATPIIAGLVARILEYMLMHSPPGTRPSPNTHVWHGITGYASQGRRIVWDRIGENGKTQEGFMILAVQKQCRDEDDDEEGEGRSR